MIAGESLGVDQDEIFFERSRRSNDLALSAHGEATAIEYQLVITADLVDVDDGNVETTSGRRPIQSPIQRTDHAVVIHRREPGLPVVHPLSVARGHVYSRNTA